MSKIQTFLQNILSARYGKDVRKSIYDAIKEIDSVADTAKDSATAKAEEARKSALSASNSATAAATSENNAKSYMESAKTSAANAKTSENNSKTSEENAKASETNAKVSEENAQAVFESLPEDYNTLSDEFYEVAIKQAVTGEQIHVDDSANAKVREFALFGKATQKTTSGKNLYNVKDIYEGAERQGTVNVEDWWECNFDNTGSSSVAYIDFNVKPSNYIEPNKDYLLVSEIVSISNCDILVVSHNDGYAQKGQFKTHVNYNKAGTYFTPIHSRDDFSDAVQMLRTVATAHAGKIATIKVRFSVFEDTTINVDTFVYEPYTGGIPSPNPEYPQEIEVSGASGSVEVKCVGKNLYNRNNDRNRTNVGVTATISDGVMVLNGTGTGAGALASGDTFTIIDAKVGDVITHSIKILDGTATIASNTSLTYVKCMNEGLQELAKPAGVSGISGTIDKNTKFPSKSFVVTEEILAEDGKLHACIQSYIRANDVYNNLKLAVQLEKGSVATEYQPYKETKATIPTDGFAGIPVDSNGNYTDSNGQQWICDEIVKYADGSGEYVQRIGKAVFDGVTNKANAIGTGQTNGTSFSSGKNYNTLLKTLVLKTGNQIDIISDYFISKVIYYTPTTTDRGAAIYRTPTNIWFSIGITLLERIGLNTTPTVADFNTWLQENPVTVYGVLAEPVVTPLTAEQLAEIEKLSTFYPVTNISNDADCGMKVTYLADSKIYIDNQITAQMDALREEMANTFALMSAETQAAMIENDTNNLLTESEE